MRITTKLIESLNPCKDRLANFKKFYPNYKGSLNQFLDLKNITHADKLWVALRVLPRKTIEVFAIDCALSAIQHASAADAADAAYAAAYADAAAAYADAAYYAAYYAANAAADAAYYAAYAVTQERQMQIEVLKYLGGK